MYERKAPTPEMNELLRRCGDGDPIRAIAAQREMAKALELPLRQGVLKGNNLFNIYERTRFEFGQAVEYPIDFLTSSNVGEFVAYTIPNTGRIPERHVEGDYIAVPTYRIGASIDWALHYAKAARWDVLGRAMSVMENQFLVKMNRDGWHVILALAAARNTVVNDTAATAGFFTKRLVALMMTTMRRNGGGNAQSTGQAKLTDLFVSPESLEDMRSWDLTQIDDVSRRQIFVGAPGEEMALSTIFGIRLHMLDELGVAQEYELYYENDLAGSLPNSKLEIVVGFDLNHRDSFVMPIREDIQIFEDVMMHRQGRAGLYGWAEVGFGGLNSVRALLGAI